MSVLVKELLEEAPNADVLLGFTPKELELELLRLVKAISRDQLRRMVSCEAIVGELFGFSGGYDMGKREPVRKAVTKAFRALEAAELIEEPDAANGRNGYRVVSEKGRLVNTDIDLGAARVRNWLKPELVHPAMPAAAMNAFAAGDYDTAVFEAFKAVESVVRKKGGYSGTDFGVPLMENAFDPKSGPLRDQHATKSRQLRRQELFKGALGELRNPKAHGDPTITDPQVAIEELLTASMLLRIVDGI